MIEFVPSSPVLFYGTVSRTEGFDETLSKGLPLASVGIGI